MFLDGDWCWDADPFQINDETRKMVVNNICFMLNSFIHCSVYENIIFCWVLHKQSIIDNILSRLDLSACAFKSVSLICSPEILTERLEKDINEGIRQREVIERSIQRLPMYDSLNTQKTDTSNLSAEDVAQIIIDM